MPADAYIKTGQRTFLNYILRPLLDRLSRAFRKFERTLGQIASKAPLAVPARLADSNSMKQ